MKRDPEDATTERQLLVPLRVVVGVELCQTPAPEQDASARLAMRQAHSQLHAARKAASRAHQHAAAVRVLRDRVRTHEWQADQAAELAPHSTSGAHRAKQAVLKALDLRSSLLRAEQAMHELRAAAQQAQRRARSALEHARRECQRLGVPYQAPSGSGGTRRSAFHELATGELG